LESERFLRGPLDGFESVLTEVFRRLGVSQSIIGIEQSIEGCNVGMFQGEVKYPAYPTWQMLTKAIPRAHFVDGTNTILSLRMIKSQEEIDAIRLAVEIANFGLSAAREAVRPGMKETELASIVESAIHNHGTGFKNVYQARGYACIYTGARSALQWTHYAYSTEREIQPDDVIIIELGCFADGYWADLTRNLYVGQPTAKAKEIYDVALGAQQRAIDLAYPGVLIPTLEKAARDFMAHFGFDKYWQHGLGHGVGTSYHEGPPLHTALSKPLETGMVLTIEPGIYIEGLGGFRPEDMIVITDNAPDNISSFIPKAL
jgi:Xaa-Pro aminopeptidase